MLKSFAIGLSIFLVIACGKIEAITNSNPNYFNFSFNGTAYNSNDPVSPKELLDMANGTFVYNKVISGNFKNVPSRFDAYVNQKGDHFYAQRFFINRVTDTLMLDIDIEIPVIGGESLVFQKGIYQTGLFLRDGTVDIPNVIGATVWSGKCPVPQKPQVSISISIWGKSKIDGQFKKIKYWQTLKSVPHNDNGTFEIESIDTINKTVKGNFKSTISSIYINLTRQQFDKIEDPTCKPEIYKVEKSDISGSFLVNYR